MLKIWPASSWWCWVISEKKKKKTSRLFLHSWTLDVLCDFQLCFSSSRPAEKHPYPSVTTRLACSPGRPGAAVWCRDCDPSSLRVLLHSLCGRISHLNFQSWALGWLNMLQVSPEDIMFSPLFRASCWNRYFVGPSACLKGRCKWLEVKQKGFWLNFLVARYTIFRKRS